MSAYKRIECTIVDKELLIRALGELGLKPAVHLEPQALKGFEGRAREERAEIIVPKSQVNTLFTGASNDLGFAWNHQKNAFDIICSDYDSSNKVHHRVLQAYAKLAIEDALVKNRFDIKETTQPKELRKRQRTKVSVVGKKLI